LLGRVKQSLYRNSLIARSGLFAVAFFAVLVMACGSSASPGDSSSPADTASDSAPTAQPTDASSSEAAPADAILAPAGTSAINSATPNPSSTTEIVIAPDFELPQAGGGTVKLSNVYSRANTVLVFYRGYF
jgi:hypothetical protein